ncbi:hypothetical protein BDZ89DRAFT_607734 [Hymenopellis radicata]|nr:hypothetical protein BDZ89DRAFT_607734 [Hymenopellis radicata]
MAKTTTDQIIRLTIQGYQGSGKTALASQLQGRSYRYHESEYGFSVVNETDYHAQFSILVYALNGTFPQDLLQEARSRPLPFCIAGTKIDLLSEENRNSYMKSPQAFAWSWDVNYVAVDNTTGHGIEDLMRSIVSALHPPPLPALTICQRLVIYTDEALCWALDCLAKCFKLPQPRSIKNSPFLPTKDELDRLLNSPAVKDWDREFLQRVNVQASLNEVSCHLITPSLIAKVAGPSEYDSMEYVRHTSIPVPRVYQDSPWMLMDYVDGRMLYECWSELSMFMQFRVACTLRLYVKQLQSLKAERPGNIADGVIPGIVFGHDYKEYGPLKSARRFRQMCEFASIVGHRPGLVPSPCPPSTDDKWTLVFNHTDLNATNIILDKEGSLWLIDWGSAGFYPASFESIGMWYVDGNGEKGDRMPRSWSRYRGFIAGRMDGSELSFWTCVRSAMHRF